MMFIGFFKNNMDTFNFNTDNMGNILHHLKRRDPNDPGVDISKIFNKNKEENLPPIQSFDEKDIKELEEFCLKMGIVGFNCANMNPKAALRMLKIKMGFPIEEDKPITENKKTILLG